MSRILRSMTYRLLHCKVFWIIMILLVVAEVGTFFFAENGGLSSQLFANHHTFSSYDHENEKEIRVYVEYEKEDPLIANKYTQNIMMGELFFIPGTSCVYEISMANVATVSMLLASVLMLIFAADVIFIMAFFGELFSDNAIRNMVTVKIRKEKVYLASLIINTIVCIAMFVIVFGVLAICTLAAGYYPLIYVPAFVKAVLVGFMVIVAVSSFSLFVLFKAQNPLLTFIFFAFIVVLSVMNFMLGVSGPVFATKYKVDETKMENFYKGGFKVEGEGEWYLPVDKFQLGRAYYPEDKHTVDFSSDIPDETYPGDAAIKLTHAVYRADIMHYPFEMMMFFIYPMYRDGLMTRYAAVSACYLVLLLTGGCYSVRKRNVS